MERGLCFSRLKFLAVNFHFYFNFGLLGFAVFVLCFLSLSHFADLRRRVDVFFELHWSLENGYSVTKILLPLFFSFVLRSSIEPLFSSFVPLFSSFVPLSSTTIWQGTNQLTNFLFSLHQIWDIAKKRIRNIFDGHQQEIYSLDFSSSGHIIVSGSGDKTARIWSMHDGSSTVLTINDPDSLNNDAGVTSVAISPDGQWVAAGSLDTVVRIWEVASGKLVERLRGHRDSVYSVAFTPNGRGLVSGSLDKTLKYWDVSGLSVGGNSGAGASGGVKSKKEGAAAAAASVSSSGAGSSVGRKDEKASPCTMNFTGHKVRCNFFFFSFL